MNIFIRADASTNIGTGHVMRCLVLAEDLRKRSVNVTFICRILPGDLIAHIENKGFSVISLPPTENNISANEDEISNENWLDLNWKTDALQTIEAICKKPEIDWLIIDHYGIEKKWERSVRPGVKRIMVIDDLANRSHDCDILLDQNLYRNLEKRYEELIPESTSTLLGPKYLLLRQEFRDLQFVKNKNVTVKRILISFGGSDPTNETMKAIKAIKIINRPEIAVDVVVGISNEKYSIIKKYCEKLPNIKIHYQIDYLAKLMSEADLAIGAGGSTTWERCYVGLPAITIETAENQSEILAYLSEIGAVWHLGVSEKVDEEDIANNILKLINYPTVLVEMVNATASIMGDFSDNLVVERLLEGE